jgi:SagB-type dehydrogenase family enzyme
MTGDRSLETVLRQRRSHRDFRADPLTLAEVAQLLWAAQGVTSPSGYRASPSAGALYPLFIHLAAGQVTDLAAGGYRYHPWEHALEATVSGDLRGELSRAALYQDFIRRAAVSLIICADYSRTTWKYGSRGRRYVHMEVGHAAQNVSLQAEALGLGTVVVGAFREEEVARLLALPREEQPLCILPVGRKVVSASSPGG